MSFANGVEKFVEPVNKLIEAVTGAIGKVYEPHYVRNMADAKAYELKVISDEMRNNSDIPSIYDASAITLDTRNGEEIAKRAGRRLAYQEICKQENVEAVVDKAYDELSGKQEIVNEEVNRDWMTRLINSVEDISDEAMQSIWAKILAGEIMEPNSFSLKTLDVVRNLSRKDAEAFAKVCEVVVENDFVPSDKKLINDMGVTFDDILALDECGLINSSGTVTNNQDLVKQENIAFDFGKYILVARLNAEQKKVLHVNAYPLTRAGRELSKVVNAENDIEFLRMMRDMLARENKDCTFALHEVIDRDGDEVEYEDEGVE